jgi:hypothetical protein
MTEGNIKRESNVTHRLGIMDGTFDPVHRGRLTACNDRGGTYTPHFIYRDTAAGQGSSAHRASGAGRGQGLHPYRRIIPAVRAGK